jgi:hypothetical protein
MSPKEIWSSGGTLKQKTYNQLGIFFGNSEETWTKGKDITFILYSFFLELGFKRYVTHRMFFGVVITIYNKNIRSAAGAWRSLVRIA